MPPRFLLTLLALFLFLAPAADLPFVPEARAADAAPALAPAAEPPFFSFAFERLKRTFPARFGVNLLTALILVLGIYYPKYRKTDFFFSLFMFNVTIFFVTYLLNLVELSMGAAFGLFAVFSLLRFRTEDIPSKDMTYLFVVIAIGLLSAANRGTLFEMVLINGSILLIAFLLESTLVFRAEESKNLQYDNIEKTKPEHYPALLQELRERTGLDIHKFTVGRIDYLRDTANIKIYYHGQPGAD